MLRSMCRMLGRVLSWAVGLNVALGFALAGGPNALAADAPASSQITVVALGDSITKGVRPGVKAEETFAAVTERRLNEQGLAVKVVNVGIGGERTDQALVRLDKIVALRPRLVLVMYGTNDSYVDQGKSASRLTLEEYRANLEKIVAGLLQQSIQPVLMTEPRWAAGARVNGVGENPNVRLVPYVEVCRDMARANRLPLVDQFAHWSAAEAVGQDLSDWTTDGCHPNPRGHEELTDLILPVMAAELKGAVAPVSFDVRLETPLKHDDGDFLWFHPRAAALLGTEGAGGPAVVMTLQKHLKVSDHYSGLHVMRSADLSHTWSGPELRPELDWVHESGGVDVAVADVTPLWHAPSGKLIAIGAQVRYNAQGAEIEDQPRSNQTAYAVLDPKTGEWTRWRRLEMPEGDQWNFARCACAQCVVEPDGTLLLPCYITASAKVPFKTVVVRCKLEGDELKYVEHGNVLALEVARGLCEPSLVRFAGRYYLTIRNDVKGYVTASEDGLHYRPIMPWLFDDGSELGSYNTQQHWLAHRDGLFLVYTRRGAENDHIFRHRAPLFIAQVDPERLCVNRATERVLVPERGATLGNFGAASIDEHESWVTVAEGIWNDEARRRGAEGAVFVARVTWAEPNRPIELTGTLAALRSGEPVRVVCFGDSVTGVYYHTGSRRAYTDMLGLALQRAMPGADVTALNAGISGHTTRDALKRIDRDVLKHQPTLVTVMFGLNDMTRVPLDEYRANLRQIVQQCRAAGAEVLLCTPNAVIPTSGRPREKLETYCQVVREVGRAEAAPVCDCYRELETARQRDPLTWRLTMSDAIHPNMDGHKRMAEQIARSITGRSVSLDDVPPAAPTLAKVRELAAAGQAIKILAMPPADEWIGAALKTVAPEAKLEITAWPRTGKNLAEFAQDAQKRVRPAKPDLVVLVMPRPVAAEAAEACIAGYSALLNWSLNFGPPTWDCLVIHPAVVDPNKPALQDNLVRMVVRAQDLSLVDRPAGDQRPGGEILLDWVKQQWSR